MRSDFALTLALPVTALTMMLVSAERLWVPAAFVWWFGLAALPGLLIMARLTRGRAAVIVFAAGLTALGVSCAANLALLDRCGEGCRFE